MVLRHVLQGTDELRRSSTVVYYRCPLVNPACAGVGVTNAVFEFIRRPLFQRHSPNAAERGDIIGMDERNKIRDRECSAATDTEDVVTLF